MKEYKGLKVPGSEGETAKDRQLNYCNPIRACLDVSCKDCLYDARNIKKFRQWEKNSQE